MQRSQAMLHVLTALTAALAFAIPAAAQTKTDFTSLMDGNRVPLILKLKDLGPDWRRFAVSPGGTLDLYTFAYSRRIPSYYTRGLTETIGGETYLIAYQISVKSSDLAPLYRTPSETYHPTPITAETPISLSLLNLRTTGSLNDIQPFDLQQELHAADEEIRRDATKASANNLEQLAVAMVSYLQDYDDTFPPLTSAATMKKALQPFIPSESTFVQPDTKQPYQPNPFFSKRKLSVAKAPASTVMIYEATPGTDGKRAVAFVDGHVKRISETDWPKLKRDSHIP
ncbi:MAG: hypothetical protein M3Y56_10730 [Armatimonadota bacterium]|nr:hypothetical protein [Armatimonadota bacterium]